MPPNSTLARLQQALTLWSLACALGWWVWHGSTSPILGAVGSGVILLGYSAVLALEFALIPYVAQADRAPRATGWALCRAWAGETWVALTVFGWRQPFAWRAVPDALSGPSLRGRHGVVFIHGFVCNRGFWTPWLRRLQADGRAFVAVNLEPVFDSIEAYVPQVQDAVDRVHQATGLPPVLVCHSMGGLVARAWLRTQINPNVVAHVVTLGSPHAGTWLARWSHLPNGRQMRQDSPWLLSLQQAWTPQQALRFTCWYSNCDNIVMPPSTATLPGADNRLLRGAAHVSLAFKPPVIDATWALIEGLDPRA